MPFFHGSRRAFPLGTKLTPQADGYVQSPENIAFEALLEGLRPESKLAREASVFLCDEIEMIDNAGGYVDCVYEVEPVGAVEASDLAWYSEAWCLYNDGDPEGSEKHAIEKMIGKYWSGERFPNPERSCVEYRAKAAKVCDYAEINIEDDEFKRMLAEFTDIKYGNPSI